MEELHIRADEIQATFVSNGKSILTIVVMWRERVDTHYWKTM